MALCLKEATLKPYETEKKKVIPCCGQCRLLYFHSLFQSKTSPVFDKTIKKETFTDEVLIDDDKIRLKVISTNNIANCLIRLSGHSEELALFTGGNLALNHK